MVRRSANVTIALLVTLLMPIGSALARGGGGGAGAGAGGGVVRLARAEVKAAWARQLVRAAEQSVAEHPQERSAAAPGRSHRWWYSQSDYERRSRQPGLK
jgi:hypothetical protein